MNNKEKEAAALDINQKLIALMSQPEGDTEVSDAVYALVTYVQGIILFNNGVDAYVYRYHMHLANVLVSDYNWTPEDAKGVTDSLKGTLFSTLSDNMYAIIASKNVIHTSKESDVAWQKEADSQKVQTYLKCTWFIIRTWVANMLDSTRRYCRYCIDSFINFVNNA